MSIIGAECERLSCRLCGALRLERVFSLPSTPLANEYPEAPGAQDTFPLWLAQCHACSAVQLPVVVPRERLYPPDYPYQSGTTATFRRHLEELAAALHMRGVRTVVEIASNDGSLLRALRRRDIMAWGVEPARRLVAGDPHVLPTFFDEHSARQVPKADCVVALNVMAHVDDMDGFMRGVHLVLAPGGLLVLEVGDFELVLERGLIDVIYHEHHCYHTRDSLQAFLGRWGFSTELAESRESQGGSLRLWARREGDVQWESSTARPRLEWELLERSRAALTARFRELRADACGYGACAKLTTMCYATDWAPALVYDDNALKIGRFTPGRNRPIVSSALLEEHQPEQCVIYAWNFADEIIAAHPHYRGTWIVPLPEWRVVR